MSERRVLHYILGPGGEVVPEPDMRKWAEWMHVNEIEGRRVGLHYVRRWCRVSTVFIGIDHNHWYHISPEMDQRPVVFETMVFGGPLDMEQERYYTLAEAVVGHAEMVVRARRATRWWRMLWLVVTTPSQVLKAVHRGEYKPQRRAWHRGVLQLARARTDGLRDAARSMAARWRRLIRQRR